jgi:hypothetical protein
MFNYQGGLVGTFGVHDWVLEDISTHQDPNAQHVQPVLNVIETLCNVAAVRKEVAGVLPSALQMLATVSQQASLECDAVPQYASQR